MLQKLSEMKEPVIISRCILCPFGYLEYLSKSELDDVVVTLNKHLKNHIDQ